MKRIFAILLVLTLLTGAFALPVSAENITNKNNNIEIIIHDKVSEETKAKIERYFTNGEPNEENASTYGITCTLLGHKIECTSVSVIEHKVRTTSPRCLKETYDYEECTRCDYEKATRVNSIYIVCCS